MTPTLLENEKVLEIFGYGKCLGLGGSGKCTHPNCMALRVLAAMSADMKMYEKGLYTCDDGKSWKEGEITGVPFVGEWHPTWLRLPDQPQRPPSGCECLDHSSCQCTCHKPSPTPPEPRCDHSNCTHDGVIRPEPRGEFSPEVEAKIKRIIELTECHGDCCNVPVNWTRDSELRQLVRLSRAGKGE